VGRGLEQTWMTEADSLKPEMASVGREAAVAEPNYGTRRREECHRTSSDCVELCHPSRDGFTTSSTTKLP
jgi:hypothetical protein